MTREEEQRVIGFPLFFFSFFLGEGVGVTNNFSPLLSGN